MIIICVLSSKYYNSMNSYKRFLESKVGSWLRAGKPFYRDFAAVCKLGSLLLTKKRSKEENPKCQYCWRCLSTRDCKERGAKDVIQFQSLQDPIPFIAANLLPACIQHNGNRTTPPHHLQKVHVKSKSNFLHATYLSSLDLQHALSQTFVPLSKHT